MLIFRQILEQYYVTTSINFLYDVFISSHLQLHINGYSDVVNLFESTILHLQYGALGYESRET